MQVWPPTYIPIIGKKQVDYMIGLFYAPEQLEKQMGSGHKFIVCYSDGIPVSFASWSEIEPHIFKLHKIYILTGQQGKGIGQAMLAHIRREVKSNGATSLRLNVNNLFDKHYFGSLGTVTCFTPIAGHQTSGCTSLPYAYEGAPRTFQVSLVARY